MRQKLFREKEDQMRHSTLSIICIVAMLFIGLAAPLAMADDGRQANATVSFGAWQTGPAAGPPPVLELDRFPNFSPRLRNLPMSHFPKVCRSGRQVTLVRLSL
jgi:hypothetical protein